MNFGNFQEIKVFKKFFNFFIVFFFMEKVKFQWKIFFCFFSKLYVLEIWENLGNVVN